MQKALHIAAQETLKQSFILLLSMSKNVRDWHTLVAAIRHSKFSLQGTPLTATFVWMLHGPLSLVHFHCRI